MPHLQSARPPLVGPCDPLGDLGPVRSGECALAARFPLRWAGAKLGAEGRGATGPIQSTVACMTMTLRPRAGVSESPTKF